MSKIFLWTKTLWLAISAIPLGILPIALAANFGLKSCTIPAENANLRAGLPVFLFVIALLAFISLAALYALYKYTYQKNRNLPLILLIFFPLALYALCKMAVPNHLVPMFWISGLKAMFETLLPKDLSKALAFATLNIWQLLNLITVVINKKLRCDLGVQAPRWSEFQAIGHLRLLKAAFKSRTKVGGDDGNAIGVEEAYQLRRSQLSWLWRFLIYAI